MTDEPRLVRVEGPHFVAAIVLEKGRCIKAAPILHWAIGKSEAWLAAYFERKGWQYEEGLK